MSLTKWRISICDSDRRVWRIIGSKIAVYRAGIIAVSALKRFFTMRAKGIAGLVKINTGFNRQAFAPLFILVFFFLLFIESFMLNAEGNKPLPSNTDTTSNTYIKWVASDNVARHFENPHTFTFLAFSSGVIIGTGASFLLYKYLTRKQ